MKHNNIFIMGITEGEESEQRIEKLFEGIMTENFPILKKKNDIENQKAQRKPNKIDPKRPSPQHIMITMTKPKEKERILKAARESQVVPYRGPPIRLSSDFSTGIFQVRREWHEIFKMMESKDLQPRPIYPARL